MVKLLGEGGQSRVYRIEPFLPLEIVAKIPKPDANKILTNREYMDLLLEDQLMKMVAHEDHVCQVLEEIIEYNENKDEIVSMISIVE